MSEFAAFNYDTSSGENSPNLEDLSRTPAPERLKTSEEQTSPFWSVMLNDNLSKESPFDPENPNWWLRQQQKATEELYKIQKNSPNLSEAFDKTGVFADRTKKRTLEQNTTVTRSRTPTPIPISINPMADNDLKNMSQGIKPLYEREAGVNWIPGFRGYNNHIFKRTSRVPALLWKSDHTMTPSLGQPQSSPMSKPIGTMTEPNNTIWKPNETWEEQLKKPKFVQKPILHSTDEDKYKKKGNEPGWNLSKSKPGKSAFFSDIDDVQAGGKIDMDGTIDYEEIMDELVQIDKKYMKIIKENKKIWDTALIQNVAEIESANLKDFQKEKRLIKDVETSIGSSRTKELAAIWSEYNEKRFDIIKKWKDMNLKTTIMKHKDHVIKNETISTLDQSKWFEEATKKEKDWKIEQIKRSEDSIKRTQIELEKLVKKKPNILKKLREKRLKKIKELSKRIYDEKNYTNRLKNNNY